MRKESPPETWEPLKSLCIFSGMRDREGLHFIISPCLESKRSGPARASERASQMVQGHASGAGSLSFCAQVTI